MAADDVRDCPPQALVQRQEQGGVHEGVNVRHVESHLRGERGGLGVTWGHNGVKWLLKFHVFHELQGLEGLPTRDGEGVEGVEWGYLWGHLNP